MSDEYLEEPAEDEGYSFGWSFPGDLNEAAWGIIANAYDGDWSKASPEWQAAAKEWRDAYHAWIKAEYIENRGRSDE